MSKPTEVTADDERFLGSVFKVGLKLLNNHPQVRDKLFGLLTARDISPDQEREINSLIGQLKPDMQEGSRDLSSDDSSERILPFLVGAASFAASNPGVVKSVWKGLSSFF